MKYKTRSIIVGRKKGVRAPSGEELLCFISFFRDINNPHKSTRVPDKIIEFEEIDRVAIKNLDINYLLPGNDIVINDLEEVEVKESGDNLVVTGKQTKRR